MLAQEVKLRELERVIKTNFTFTVKDFSDFIINHDIFVDNYHQELFDFLVRSSSKRPRTAAVSALFDQRSKAYNLVNSINSSYGDGRVLKIAGTIIDLFDYYNSFLSLLIFEGFDDEIGFKEVFNFREYIIDKDTSLDEIARQELGSIDKLEILIIDNPWITSLSRDQLLGKTLLIRQNLEVISSFSSNLGEKSWGLDLPVDLSVENGDLLVLNEKETLEQTISNIIKFPRNSVPEDLNIGNPLLESIGQNYLTLDEALGAQMLKEVLESEPSINQAKVTNVESTQDKIQADVWINPVNSEEIIHIDL